MPDTNGRRWDNPEARRAIYAVVPLILAVVMALGSAPQFSYITGTAEGVQTR